MHIALSKKINKEHMGEKLKIAALQKKFVLIAQSIIIDRTAFFYIYESSINIGIEITFTLSQSDFYVCVFSANNVSM